jgi:hypothetical protein
MTTYKLIKNIFAEITTVERNISGIICSIPFDPANTDYANFKTAILEDKAQLQDADGNTMTAEQAKDFIKELP